VALVNLAANQVLVDGMFVDPASAQVSAITQRLEDDNVAMSISVDATRSVGGLLVPGDLVNIMYLPAGEEETGIAGARMVYHQARILAIGAQSQAAQPAPGTAEGTLPLTSGLITLDLPVDAAQLVASLPAGNLVLTLTGPDYTAQPIPALEVSDLEVLPGETDARTRFGTLTPYGPDGPQ
jgi:Flp pilus assembly protein CpaB